MGNTQIPTRNVCIYCHKIGILLTDEHVVPYSLGGKHVLQRASCVQCANITKKFEQDVARDLWGDARASYNAPTRRKHERPKLFNLRDPKGLAPDIAVSPSEYPAPMVFYVMPTAGILIGEEPTRSHIAKWQLVVVVDEARRKDFLAKYPGRLTGAFKHVPQSFGRLIAKIGYCHALTALDPGDFTPICLPYIVGKKSNISYVVGSRQPNDPRIPELGYFLRTILLANEDRMILLVEVRLLADNDTPTYHVVVGEIVGEEAVKNIKAKLNVQASSERTEPVFQDDQGRDIFKLTPTVWPLRY
jgi:hypothetical protein